MADPVSRRPPSEPPRVLMRGRRPFHVAIILVLFCVAVAGAAMIGWRMARESPPHKGPIILISIDTLRADHLPLYGYKGVATPNIDALAADAVVFDRAYAHSPQTLPSHVSLLTGRLPFEHGVRDDAGFMVRDAERTLAKLLRGRGFSTGAAVSSYLLRKETGLAQGFQVYDADLPPVSPATPGGALRRDGTETLAAAEKWMSGLGGDPRFFLFLHLFEPHRPYAPPARFAALPQYDAEIAYVDELVGRLTGWLKERRWYDRATIILAADHGEGLGDHGEQEHGLLLYEEAIRVPLIIKLPDAVSAGRRVLSPVQHIDLVPTILDFVRAPAPGGLRGRSLRAVLESPKAILPDQPLYAESLYGRLQFGWSELYALSNHGLRYIRAPREELYDLQADPRERRNIVGERTAAADQMRSALDRLTAGATITAPAPVGDEEREHLALLGYVGGAGPPADTPASGLPDPKDTVAVLDAYRRGVDQVSRRDYAGATATLQAILAAHPDMADLWQQLGSLLMRSGRAEEAIGAYERGLALRPNDPAALVAAGDALLRLRKLDEAAASADLAVQQGAGNPRAIAAGEELRARVALTAKDADAARLHATRAAEADPALPVPQFIEGRLLYDQGKYEEALAQFEAALTIVRDRPKAMRDLQLATGETLSRLDRFADAEQHFREELHAFPDNLRAWTSLATIYNAQGRRADAAEAVDDLIAAVPTPEAYGVAARVLTIIGDRSRAERLRASGRQKFKGDPAIKLLDAPPVSHF